MKEQRVTETDRERETESDKGRCGPCLQGKGLCVYVRVCQTSVCIHSERGGKGRASVHAIIFICDSNKATSFQSTLTIVSEGKGIMVRGEECESTYGAGILQGPSCIRRKRLHVRLQHGKARAGKLLSLTL